MPLLDLRKQAARERFELPEGLVLGDAERAAAIATWRERMVNEHASARVFAALIPQLMGAGVGADHQAQVAEMVSEELRHGRLCAAVVQALGAEAVCELPPLPDVPTHADASPLEGLLRNVISISCLNETMAVAILEADRHRVGPPALAGVLRRILADEVGHARFGWRLLEEVGPSLDGAQRRRLSEYLVVAFRQLLLRHFAGPGTAPSEAAAALAVCNHGATSALLLATLREGIVPGLEAHGLAAGQSLQRALAS